MRLDERRRLDLLDSGGGTVKERGEIWEILISVSTIIMSRNCAEVDEDGN